MSKLINKNIIKAMTIGISAVMAASSMNLSAFAEEATNTTPEPITPDGDDEQTAATASQLAIVLDTIGTLEDEEKHDIVDDVHDAESSFTTAQTSYDTAKKAEEQPVEEAEPQNDGENILLADGNAQQPAAENAETAKTATEYVEEVADKLDGMDTQDTLIAGAYSNANSKATDANTEVGVGEGLEKEANDLLGIVPEGTEGETVTLIDIIVGADEIVDEQSEVIAGATTEGEAQEAYDTAATAVAGASKNVDDTQSELTRIEGELAASKEKYDAAVSARDGILADLATAQQNYETLKEQASEAAENAKSELERLSGLAAGYETDAKDALAAYNSTGYGLIAYYENYIKNFKPTDEKKALTWDDYRNLVKATMEFYYVPDVLGGSNFGNWEWFGAEKFGNGVDYSETVDNSTKGNVLNYGVFTYDVVDENGETVTKTMRVNYKTADGNGTNINSKAGIVIFEKVDHLVLDGHDLTDAIKNGVDTDGYYFDEAGNAYGKDAEGNYVKYETAEPVEAISESDSRVDGIGTVVDIVENTEKVSVGFDEAGNLVRTVKADVVTTTYTQASLTTTETVTNEKGQDATLSEEDAKANYVAELKEIVKGLKEGQKITIVIGKDDDGKDITKDYAAGDENKVDDAGFEYYKTSVGVESDVFNGKYKVSGTYQEKFTKTKEIKDSHKNLVFDASEEDARKDYNKAVRDFVDDYTYSDEFFDHQQKYTLIESSSTDPKIERVSKKEYSYEGTVTVTYQKLKSESVGNYFAMVEGFLDLFRGKNTEKEREDLIRAKLEEQGKTLVAFDGYDITKGFLGIGEATIYYVDAQTVTDREVTADTEEAAKAAFETSLGSSAYNVKVTSAVAQTEKKVTSYNYGYRALSYLLSTTTQYIKDESTTATQATISTTTWDEIAAKSFTEYRNDNWYTGNILLSQYDKEKGRDYATDNKTEDKKVVNYQLNAEQSERTADFRSKIDRAADIAAKYAQAAKDAADAQLALNAAKGRVEDLKNQLAELQATGGTLTEVSAWAASLADAQQALTDAITKRDELVKKLADLEKQFNDKVDEIRAAEAAAAEAAAAAAATTTTTTTIAATETPAAAAPAVAAPAPAPAPAPAVANPDNPANQVVDNNADDNTQNTETIENEESALAEGIGEKKTENIEGDETALSEGIGTQTAKKNWPWWWILIVAAVTGGTTFGVIKGNQKKKATEETKKTDK